MPDADFRCYQVRKDEAGTVTANLESVSLDQLPPGEVLLKVHYSSLNYKDAMAAHGHPGITRKFPHVPGIDACGVVIESSDPRFRAGEEVLATGHEFGVERWGGWSEYLRSPADWLVPLPDGLTREEAMTLGTAGFTAAQCVQALRDRGIQPDQGDILVTGATGGVGSLAVMILARLGYRVVALTGKSDRKDWLLSLGAADVVGRDLLEDTSSRPLLSARFRGAIDTVGGPPLAALCKSISHRGCVACCGVTAGAELPLTVYPFILRGVTLAGIDSAWCPDEERQPLWQLLAGPWKPQQLTSIGRTVSLTDIAPEVERILRGENVGRVIVTPGG